MALTAYLGCLTRGGDADAATIAAAEAVAASPWDVVHQAGLLARCVVVRAERDLGLTVALRICPFESSQAIAMIPAGSEYPTLKHPSRRARGAFDTPMAMARGLVGLALQHVSVDPQQGLDPACGTGAFLVAMAEAGIPAIFGADLDARALAVAQIACPRAKLTLADALSGGEEVDLVVANPPFVGSEGQDKVMRAELRRRFPWLRGRFDLVIPLAAAAVDRVRDGGVVGLVLPAPALNQGYGAELRRRWVGAHAICEVTPPHGFPGASIDVVQLVMRKGGGPASLPGLGIHAQELLRLPNVPLNAELQPGDVDLVERIRAASVPLRNLCFVDTGVVAHLPGGTRENLLFDEPGKGRVPYADAREFFSGQRRYLQYTPAKMHRAKSPALFEGPKIVLQRVRGDGPVRAAIDSGGTYVGHTCTVVAPRSDNPVPLEKLLELIQSAVVDGLLRMEGGERLDLYPRDVASIPVPHAWLSGDVDTPAERAWGISEAEVLRLQRFARR